MTIVTSVGLGGAAGKSLLRALLAAVLSFGVLLSEPTAGRAQATEAGQAELLALRTEARAYEHGEGVPKNPVRALELYCKAARRGDAEAQFSLGWIYANGRGVARNESFASFFFDLAAKQGHEHAEKMLRYVGDAVGEPPECLRVRQVAGLPVPTPVIKIVEGEAPEFVATTPAQKRALELVKTFAPDYGINPRLALAIIRFESNFDPMARSEKNAQGLMQLIPETASRFNVAKPFDPVQNVRGGLAYLRWLLAYFQGDVKLVAAAYNAGEGTVNRYRGIPPYPETRAYVRRIVEFFGRPEHPYDANVTEHSPELYRIRAATGS